MCATTSNPHNAKFLCFNLSMFTEEAGTSINNEDSKEFQIRKIAKMYRNFLTLNEP